MAILSGDTVAWIQVHQRTLFQIVSRQYGPPLVSLFSIRHVQVSSAELTTGSLKCITRLYRKVRSSRIQLWKFYILNLAKNKWHRSKIHFQLK